MIYTEEYGNLFSLQTKYALVHCIATDAEMGKGIATQFVNLFPNMKKHLQNLDLHIGDAIPFRENDSTRLAINLVTKGISRKDKPTRADFNRAIINLKELVIENNIKHLGLPRLGSGLDKLSWDISSKFIQETFRDVDVEIIVCIN